MQDSKRPDATMRPAKGGFGIFAVLALIGLGLVGAGVNRYRELKAGQPAKATVTRCDKGRRTIRCTGTWTSGGSLLQGGRVVRGPIEGASPDDVGRTIDVLVVDDHAYTSAVEQPAILLGIGAAVLALASLIGAGLLKSRRAAARAPRAPRG